MRDRTRACSTVLQACCLLTITACAAVDASSIEGELSVPADPYDEIKYMHCVGYQGPGKLDEGITTCSTSADCAGQCGTLGSNEACTCDKSCGCCFKEDKTLPGPGRNVCRYSWSECPADGSACPASYEGENQYTWFGNVCDLTKPSDVKDEYCMMHIPDPPSGGQPAGCLYKTTSPGSRCSRPSTGGAGAYECGDKTCAGNESFQCNPGPTGTFTYTLVHDGCGGQPTACTNDTGAACTVAP